MLNTIASWPEAFADEKACGEPGEAEAPAREHVRHVVDVERNAGESDCSAGHRHERPHPDTSATAPKPLGEEHGRSTEACDPRSRMAAREGGGRREVNRTSGIGTWAVEPALEQSHNDL